MKEFTLIQKKKKQTNSVHFSLLSLSAITILDRNILSSIRSISLRPFLTLEFRREREQVTSRIQEIFRTEISYFHGPCLCERFCLFAFSTFLGAFRGQNNPPKFGRITELTAVGTAVCHWVRILSND